MNQHQTAVITGASAGIGRALALELASRGYRLGLTSRRLPALEEVRASIRAAHPGAVVEVAAIDVDRTDALPAALDELFGRLGGVDLVVVNAGVNAQTRVGLGDFAVEQRLVQTNLIGAMATVHACARYFRERGGGHIVGISSLAALGAIPTQAAYCATKAGLSMYLDAARMELARFGVDVTAILPGFVRTEIVPDMDKYPFIVSAQKAAVEMADIIESRAPEGVVPAFPWKYIRPVMGHIPKGVLRKLSK